eukprot:1186152-Prorocentrum_minimum.AAC.1
MTTSTRSLPAGIPPAPHPSVCMILARPYDPTTLHARPFTPQSSGQSPEARAPPPPACDQ